MDPLKATKKHQNPKKYEAFSHLAAFTMELRVGHHHLDSLIERREYF